ncbi:acetylserotonin O-methyltransferase isoform X3 [Chroicocephalus ridibundus]
MFTASELGVFDLLLESGEPLSSGAIAARLGTSTTGMERLLDACVGLKLLAVELTKEGALYRNTEISNIYLTKSSPKSQYHIMMYYSNTVYLCWHYLADAVREGRNQYERVFGISSEDPFGAMYRSEEEMLKFMAGQNSVWSICGRDVLAAFDLSPFRQICDLGGGGGALARECVSLYPNSTVTIYDLPKVVQVAKEQFIPPEEHRITFHEGRCGQCCSVVTAVAPEHLVCSEVPQWRIRSPAAPYGQCVPDHSLSSPDLQFIATTGLSQLCICSYLLSETQLSYSATQKLFTPEQNYLISSEQGYFKKKNKPKSLAVLKNCHAML